MGSGYKDFAPGDVLAAADVDGYLMRQTMMTFADAATRDTALSGVLDEGMHAYLNDTNATTVYDGSAWVTKNSDWTTFTPSWNSFAIGNGTTDTAKYRETDAGTWINVVITFGSTTSVSGVIQLNYPGSVTCTGQPHLTGTAFDSTASTWYMLGCRRASDTALALQHTEPTLSTGSTSATAPFTWATSDSLRLSIFVPLI